MTDQQLVMTFPLSPTVQAELGERIQTTVENAEPAVIGCFDPETGFALVAHCTDQGPMFWECCGPVTERQAHAWINGIESDLKADVAVIV